MSDEPGILPEPIPFGTYYLLERISVGGMAEIYKAKAFGVEGFERLLAVKKILSSIAEDESFIEMFIDEAKIAGQLNHPNIAQIYDLGKVDGSYYIALEYISGKDMKTIFERARRVGEEVDIPQVCHVAMKVCEGLAHAHGKTDSQGRDLEIVHRDISPQNILISYEGEVKIIDFGIAKAQGKTSQTQVGVLKGKFSYMSPEQVRGLHVDHRSDIFSLGIVLYEMLTLERLFLGESDFDTLEKIRKVEMSPPSLYNPNIPEQLEDIVLKALARNPDERYQSASELAEALERFMRDEGYYYKNTDLAAFMKEAFREDLEFERKKLEYYQGLDLEQPDERSEEENPEADEGGLVWDEEEMETQIFDDQHGGGGGSRPNPGDSQPAPAARAEGGAGAGSGVQPAANDGRSSGAVEVVGPDNQVDTIGPDNEVEPVEEPDGRSATVEYDRWAVEEGMEQLESGAEEEAVGEQPSSPGAEPRPSGPEAPVEGRREGAGSRFWVVGGTAAAIMFGALTVAWFAFLGEQTAEIEFSTTPEEVRVLLDGKQVFEGKTPTTVEARPGPTEIAVERDGYEPFQRTKDLKAGNTYQLSTSLEEKSDGSGELFVSSEPPGASVEVDGSSVEDPTPVTITDLSAGAHRVVVSKEGYLDGEEEFDLDEGEERDLEIRLRPEEVDLAVKSSPEGAEFTVYDEEDEEVAEGETPETVEGLAGDATYRIAFERSGYEDAEETFEPGHEREATVDVSLTRERARGSRTVARTRGSSGGGSTGREEEDRGSTPSAQGESSGDSRGAEESAPEPQPDPEPTGKATLQINSRPVAKVFIDGKDTGQRTPLLNYEVEAGKHEILFVNEDFGLERTKYVHVKPGETEKVIVQAK